MIAKFVNTIELGFWNLFITLLSRSSVFRAIIRSTYLLSQDKTMLRKIAIIVLICCAGLASGLVIFSVSLIAA